MARLFVGQREVQFINDIGKELIKDVVGQFINYFPVSTIKSDVHAIYNEAIQKIFENPIRILALVGMPEYASKTTNFGPDLEVKLEVLIQYRDLQDKNVILTEGDFFTYDDVLYEIITVTNAGKYIFGLAEYNTAWKITARNARLSQFDIPNYPPPRLISPDAVQTVFEQQRGLKVTSDGQATGDVREMRDRLKEQMAPIALGTGARKVEQNTGDDGDFIQGNDAISFNNDPLPPKKGIYDED
jgi:hypothetical protein